MHIQKILDENVGLIQTIQDYQLLGKMNESISFQVALHRNLVYLATLADPQQNIAALLPVSELTPVRHTRWQKQLPKIKIYSLLCGTIIANDGGNPVDIDNLSRFKFAQSLCALLGSLVIVLP